LLLFVYSVRAHTYTQPLLLGVTTNLGDRTKQAQGGQIPWAM